MSSRADPPLGIVVSSICDLYTGREEDAGKKLSNSRSILITPVKDHEGVRPAEEILLIKFVGTELHSSKVLGERQMTRES